jgi:nucleoside-diphosphate-sugar epimerase
MSAADGRLIPALLASADAGGPLPIHGTGLQTRSMTYVADAIELLQIVMRSPQLSLEPVNIGNDDERTILEIAEAFAQAAGVPFEVEFLPARPSDPQRRKPELTRARSFGWSPATPLEAGLRETVEWFRGAALSGAY